ncbi:DUF4393 domain-containing protein [Vibrio cholerae]|nr:DUF4393 domain-containing protein [Vibrio cholerae]ELU3953803.1 DUF4393 domain-containing protein [Vibrio cholerae]
MSNEGSESSVEGTIKAVSSLVEKVPVYQDAVQPLAKETGKALGTVGRAVNAALSPLRGVVWGIERIEEFVHTKVGKKLESVPPENIQTPDLSVAGPALESLKYVGHKESLSDMYASLLASSMNKDTSSLAHPGFVEIIRNMSPDEAKIMKFLSSQGMQPYINVRQRRKVQGGTRLVIEKYSHISQNSNCENHELCSASLVNLERLGLLELCETGSLSDNEAYTELESEKDIQRTVESLTNDDTVGEIQRAYVGITPLGKMFARVCITY